MKCNITRIHIEHCTKLTFDLSKQPMIKLIGVERQGENRSEKTRTITALTALTTVQVRSADQTQ
jgi:hypothetical protein